MKFISERQRRERRRRAQWVLAGVAGFGMAALAGGAVLPAERVMSGTAEFDRSPEVVWRVLTDLDGMPLWRSDVVTLERLPDQDGKTVWRETGKRTSRVIELSLADPPHRLVMQATAAGRPGYPMRSVELTVVPHGTRVSVTERTTVSNPLLRLLVRLAPGPSPVERLLHDLDERLNRNRRQVAAGDPPMIR